MYEGAIVGEYAPDVSEETLGIAMIGGTVTGRRRRERDRRPHRLRAGAAARGTVGLAARLALYQRAGGVVTPLLTALLAFLVGGLVVLRDQWQEPAVDLQGDLQRDGPQLALRVGLILLGPDPATSSAAAAGNLQQTLIQFTVLVLTGLAVAFAFRCGLFNIGGQGQYIVGTIAAVQIGRLVRRRSPRCRTSCWRSSLRRRSPARSGPGSPAS